MKTYHYTISILLLFLLTPSECFDDNITPIPIDLDQKSARLVESYNQFGFNFFETVLISKNSKKNLMASPLSVSQALSMALYGAMGSTYTKMQNSLGFVAQVKSNNVLFFINAINFKAKRKTEIKNRCLFCFLQEKYFTLHFLNNY